MSNAYRDIQTITNVANMDYDKDCWACRAGQEQTFTLEQVKHLLFVKYGLEPTADSEWNKNIKIMEDK